MSPDSHSSTVATFTRSPCSLSIDMGRTCINEPVNRFFIPSFVETNFDLLAIDPFVLFKEPYVKNLNSGPLDRIIAVLNNDITSSDCFIVGAVVT